MTTKLYDITADTNCEQCQGHGSHLALTHDNPPQWRHQLCDCVIAQLPLEYDPNKDQVVVIKDYGDRNAF